MEELCEPNLIADVLHGVPGHIRHEWLMSSEHEILLMGEPLLTQHLCDLQFDVSPSSFSQTNPAQAEVLYKLAISAAGKSGMQEQSCLLHMLHMLGPAKPLLADFAAPIGATDCAPCVVRTA